MSNDRWKNIPEIKVRIHDETFTFVDQTIKIFHETLRCIYFYRVVNNIMKSQPDPSAAIIIVNNSLFSLSVLGWSKIFGSNKENTGFKKMIIKSAISNDFKGYFASIGIHDKNDLIESLLNKIQMNSAQFDVYKNDLKTFRNKHIAHTDLYLYKDIKDPNEKKKRDNARLKKYPDLGPAEKSLIWFYGLVRNMLEVKKSTDFNCRFRYLSSEELISFTNDESSELHALLSKTSNE